MAPAQDNVIVYPTSYGGQHPDLEWLIGPDGILDPTRWFIVQPNMFGSGLSSSPSNTPDYPDLVTSWDNVHAQRRLLQAEFGIDEVACVYGWSMGAQQAYHWAAAFPDAVARIVVNCGSARTTVHNRIFLASLMAALEAAPEYQGRGQFSAQPKAALRVFGRIYAGWGPQPGFLPRQPPRHRPRRDRSRHIPCAPIGRSDSAAAPPPTSSRCSAPGMPATSAPTRSTTATSGRALQAIKARVLLMPGETDPLFPRRRQRGRIPPPAPRNPAPPSPASGDTAQAIRA